MPIIRLANFRKQAKKKKTGKRKGTERGIVCSKVHWKNPKLKEEQCWEKYGNSASVLIIS